MARRRIPSPRWILLAAAGGCALFAPIAPEGTTDLPSSGGPTGDTGRQDTVTTSTGGETCDGTDEDGDGAIDEGGVCCLGDAVPTRWSGTTVIDDAAVAWAVERKPHPVAFGDSDSNCLPELWVSDGVGASVLLELPGRQWAEHARIDAAAPIHQVTPTSDPNGDGHPDVWLSLPQGSEDSPTAAVYLLHGPFSGVRTVADAVCQVVGPDDATDFGARAAAADLDGDGGIDLAVGSILGNEVVALHPATAACAGVRSASDASARVTSTTWMGFGAHLVADVDGDGIADLLHNAWYADSGSRTWIVDGPLVGERDISTAISVVRGTETGDVNQDDSLVTAAEDLDGDGHVDLLVGAPGASLEPSLYVVAGPVPAGDVAARDLAVAQLVGGLATGLSGGPAGDLDRDGFTDLVVGAPINDPLSAGAVHVVYGPWAGTVLLADGATFLGGAAWDYTGYSAVAPGDLDGDGSDDLAVMGLGALYALPGPAAP